MEDAFFKFYASSMFGSAVATPIGVISGIATLALAGRDVYNNQKAEEAADYEVVKSFFKDMDRVFGNVQKNNNGNIIVNYGVEEREALKKLILDLTLSEDGSIVQLDPSGLLIGLDELILSNKFNSDAEAIEFIALLQQFLYNGGAQTETVKEVTDLVAKDINEGGKNVGYILAPYVNEEMREGFENDNFDWEKYFKANIKEIREDFKDVVPPPHEEAAWSEERDILYYAEYYPYSSEILEISELFEFQGLENGKEYKGEEWHNRYTSYRVTEVGGKPAIVKKYHYGREIYEETYIFGEPGYDEVFNEVKKLQQSEGIEEPSTNYKIENEPIGNLQTLGSSQSYFANKDVLYANGGMYFNDWSMHKPPIFISKPESEIKPQIYGEISESGGFLETLGGFQESVGGFLETALYALEGPKEILVEVLSNFGVMDVYASENDVVNSVSDSAIDVYYDELLLQLQTLALKSISKPKEIFVNNTIERQADPHEVVEVIRQYLDSAKGIVPGVTTNKKM